MDELAELSALDDRLMAAAASVKVLSTLAWKPEVEAEFLSGWQRGDPRLPRVTYADRNNPGLLAELEGIIAGAGTLSHPLGDYLEATARSYWNVARMLEHLGESRMTKYSVAVYGQPGDALSGSDNKTSLDAARFFLQTADDFYRGNTARESDYCLSAQFVKRELESRLEQVFGPAVVKVVVDPVLASKAAAGATRIRLRDATCFSEYDVEQLLQHEAFVHSLTALNGRAQNNLRSLGLGAPRTTAAQEGLATFAELITGAMDMARLMRIAMRIVAIDMALQGADFIQVFKFFIDSGQPIGESFSSTMRVFRGSPTSGGSAFTKDAVYLHSLLEIHTFFRWALQHQRLGLCEHFFAGRMTLGDAIRLEPLFSDGTLVAPKYLPPWMDRAAGLAGSLAFSVFANGIDLDLLDSEHAFESLDR